MARASSGGSSKAKGAPRLRYKRRFFRNRPNAGAKINSVTGRKLIRSMMTPPSTYNATVSTGTYVKLTHGAKYSVVHSRIPIGDVYLNYQPDEAYPNLYIEMFDTGAAIGGSHFLGGNTGYLPDPIHDLICLFQEHNYFSACYEFTPRVTGGTTTGYGITWGFSADPMYGKEHNITGNFPSLFTGYGYTPSENQVKAMDGSTQFPAWVPTACYDVTSKFERKWKYTAGQDIVTGLFNPNDNPATNRQCYSGCFFLSGRSNARTDIEFESIVLLGTLWLTTKIGVREFAPAATLSVAFSKATRLINRLHGTDHMKLLLEHIASLSDKKIIMHKGKVKTMKKKKKDDEKSDDVELELLDDVELVSGETARSYLDKKDKEKERTRSSTPARSVSSRAA